MGTEFRFRAADYGAEVAAILALDGATRRGGERAILRAVVTYIDMCEQARRQPDSETAARARAIQRAEWQLLFDYCAKP